MASSFSALKDLDLSRDEVERIGNALKDKEFRKLFSEYVEELHDPENRKLYQEEITQLEKERGIDVTFINPVAGYVLKTSVDGNKKCFINVCSNEHVKKPSSMPAVRGGSKGLQWSLPHSLSPAREDVDHKGIRCVVYDVVFHPDTIHLAQNNKAFHTMVSNTACEAIEANFEVALDKKNLKFPKMQYKGMPNASVIRKPSKDTPVECDTEQQTLFEKLYSNADYKPKSPKKSKPKKSKQEDSHSVYTRPTFIIKHRTHVDLQEYTENRNAKLNTAIPKELVVEVDLPLLKSSADITLDVMEKSVHLISEKPAKYKLEMSLPYQVMQDMGNAKFDKDLKKLVITLPVKRPEHVSDLGRDDSGVESDHGSPISLSPSEDNPLITEVIPERELVQSECDFRTSNVAFLDENLDYNLPDFTCHVFENNIAFTLNVKNVSESSLEKIIDENGDAIHVQFVSVSSGFFPVHYAFFVKLSNHLIDADTVSLEAWDNNVILQFAYKPSDEMIKSYLVGLHKHDLTLKYVEEPCILNGVLKVPEERKGLEETEEKVAVAMTTKQQIEKTSEDDLKQNTSEKEQEIKPGKLLTNTAEKQQTKAIDIAGVYSESSGDEQSCSYSPSKSRGILKRLGRRSVSRSISESSLDELWCVSSFENCHTSLDSVIPEDGEVSTSLKKTVRFNDNVSRQLYRSNSSILGQKKKNQRKAKNKKRANERRYSESEASETEDRKERDDETGGESQVQPHNGFNEKRKDSDTGDFASDMFQLDMYF